MLDPHGEIVALHAVEPAVVSTVECTVVRRRDVPCPVALMHELRDLVCRLLLEKKKAQKDLRTPPIPQRRSNGHAVCLSQHTRALCRLLVSIIRCRTSWRRRAS